MEFRLLMATGKRCGGCLCGQIRYEAPARPLGVAICHCRDCQKQAGSALSILAVFPRDAVSFEGTLSLFTGRGSSGDAVLRYFCGQCGSPIYSDSETMRGRGILAIKAGTLDEVADLEPTTHYWTTSKQAWLQLPENAVRRERD